MHSLGASLANNSTRASSMLLMSSRVAGCGPSWLMQRRSKFAESGETSIKKSSSAFSTPASSPASSMDDVDDGHAQAFQNLTWFASKSRPRALGRCNTQPTAFMCNTQPTAFMANAGIGHRPMMIGHDGDASSDDFESGLAAEMRIAESERMSALERGAANVMAAADLRAASLEHFDAVEALAAQEDDPEQRVRVIKRNARLLHANFALTHNQMEAELTTHEWWQRLNSTGTFAFSGPAKAQLPLAAHCAPAHVNSSGRLKSMVAATRTAASAGGGRAIGDGRLRPAWQNPGRSYRRPPEAAEYRVRSSQLSSPNSSPMGEREGRQHGRRLSEVEQLRMALSRVELDRLHTHRRMSEELAWSQTLLEQADRREQSLKIELEQVRTHLGHALDELTATDAKHRRELDRVRAAHVAELLAERSRIDELIQRQMGQRPVESEEGSETLMAPQQPEPTLPQPLAPSPTSSTPPSHEISLTWEEQRRENELKLKLLQVEQGRATMDVNEEVLEEAAKPLPILPPRPPPLSTPPPPTPSSHHHQHQEKDAQIDSHQLASPHLPSSPLPLSIPDHQPSTPASAAPFTAAASLNCTGGAGSASGGRLRGSPRRAAGVVKQVSWGAG